MSALNFPLSRGRKLLASSPAPSPRGEEQTWWSRPYLNEGTLDSDLAVIIAAMVYALICAFGLHLLLRCARCYNRRMRVDSSRGVATRPTNNGLKKATMKALPIVVYTSASKVPPGFANDCPICLAEFGDGEKVRVLPDCNHAFHMQCIDKWLTSHSSCPLCRHCLNLLSRNRKSDGAPITQAAESNNAIHVVVDITDSTQATPPPTQRSQQEVTEVRYTSPQLSPTSDFENQSSCNPNTMNNVG